MSEKELKEMMISEETDHDEVEKRIEDPKEEIERMLKTLNKASSEEKEIMKRIRGLLDKHELRYSYDEEEPKHIGIGFGMENKSFKVHVILQNGKVIIKLCFPFRVQANAIAIMGIYMTEFNCSGTAFSPLSTDFANGEIYMDYSYVLEKPEDFNEEYFWVYLTSHIKFALEIYIKVSHLSVGMVPRKDRELYKKLLEMALETVNGDFDDNSITYGTESLKTDYLSNFPDFFEKDNGNECKVEDSDSDDEDITFDMMRRLRRRRRVPSFNEFMRMDMQAEYGEEETEDQPKEASSMLSMFAKRDDKKDSKAVGGNKDE